jgi:hypothetical protein
MIRTLFEATLEFLASNKLAAGQKIENANFFDLKHTKP